MAPRGVLAPPRRAGPAILAPPSARLQHAPIAVVGRFDQVFGGGASIGRDTPPRSQRDRLSAESTRDARSATERCLAISAQSRVLQFLKVSAGQCACNHPSADRTAAFGAVAHDRATEPTPPPKASVNELTCSVSPARADMHRETN